MIKPGFVYPAEKELIAEYTRKGYSAARMKRELKLPFNVRTIQNHMKPHRPVAAAPATNGRDELDWYHGQFYYIVVDTMIHIGKDPHTCFLCGVKSDRRLFVHHTKYEGATVFDLEFVCRSCNNSPINKGLK